MRGAALLCAALFGAALLALVPDVAHACPVCFDANEANRDAFVWTTVFMSALPLSIVGGIVLWLRQSAREREDEITRR